MSNENKTSNDKELSIQLSSDGFSFCTYNPQNKKYETFFHKEFGTPHKNPEEILKAVKNIFKNEILLHEHYNKVCLIHHNNLSTFVPQAYFDEQILSDYLKNTTKIFNNDYITYDEINDLKTNNVYVPFVNVNNFVFDTFGSFTYLHSSSVFLQNIVKTHQTVHKKMFVNVYSNNFQLMVLEQNQLVLSNYFDYQTKEDFVYYILFVAEQLKMNPNTFELTLFGQINKQDKTYQLLYHYVRNVFVYSTLNTQLGTNIKTQPQAHFNLLQLHV